MPQQRVQQLAARSFGRVGLVVGDLQNVECVAVQNAKLGCDRPAVQLQQRDQGMALAPESANQRLVECPQTIVQRDRRSAARVPLPARLLQSQELLEGTGQRRWIAFCDEFDPSALIEFFSLTAQIAPEVA